MNTYNANFDDISNLAIERLVIRTKDSRKARINRKNSESSLDQNFHFIHTRWLDGKSLPQILAALKNEHSQTISKSALSRFINKKFKVINN